MKKQGKTVTIIIRWKQRGEASKQKVQFYLEFTNGREQASPIHSKLSLLLAQAKLNSEEVALKQRGE